MKYISIIHVYILIFLLSSLCFNTSLKAEHNTSADSLYKSVSTYVIDSADYLDEKVSRWLGNDDVNNTCLPEPITNIYQSNDTDIFFQNNKYLNETRDIYVRLRMDNHYYSRESNKIKFKLSARLPFDRCKKQFQLFFQDENTYADEVKSTDTSDGGVGIRYYEKERYGINSSYSIGLRSQSPYIRARYSFPWKYHSWKIEPVHMFKYSDKYYLEQETNIYFDKSINKEDLFRVQLHREEGSKQEGIDYGLIFEYYLHAGKNSGLRLRQSFFGNTHYNDVYKNDKNYHGINNYVTSVSWRENIWRDWLYYEVRPSINHHKDYNYKPSYEIRFFMDIYFGKYHK